MSVDSAAPIPPPAAAARAPARRSLLVRMAERGTVPDALIRLGIRMRLRALLRALSERAQSGDSLGAWMQEGPLAIETRESRAQHYDLPPEFFALVLGRHKKYSACSWPAGTSGLDEAERQSLEQVSARAVLADGQRILELGCGWGSFCLWAAERYPRARITALSHSALQRGSIEEEAGRRGLDNLEVRTADMNEFEADGRFDRIVSIEMFEHMRNWRLLFERVRRWLQPGALLFTHVFCHRRHAYPFEAKSEADWMARHFFTGGLMPAEQSAASFARQAGLEPREHWYEDGRHYARTARAWLANLDRESSRVLGLFRRIYGVQEAELWEQRWRIFFLACEELWAYRGGQEWGVSHDLFQNPG